MRIFIGLLLLGLGVVAAYIGGKDIVDQRKKNQKNVIGRKKTAYLWVELPVILLAVNDEQWATRWTSLLGTTSQEVIVPTGEVQLRVCTQEWEGLAGIVKKKRAIKKVEDLVTIELRRGRQYELSFDTEEADFLIQEVTEMVWKTPLNQQFRQKYKRKKRKKIVG